MSQPPPGQPQRRILSTQHIQQLMATYRLEMAAAQAAGQNTPAAQEHLTRANHIREALVRIQQQRTAAAAAAGRIATPPSQPQQQQPQQPQQQQQSRPGTPGAAMVPPQQQQPRTPTVTQLGQVQRMLREFRARLHQIEQAEQGGRIPQDQLALLAQQKRELHAKYEKYSMAARQMQQQLRASGQFDGTALQPGSAGGAQQRFQQPTATPAAPVPAGVTPGAATPAVVGSAGSPAARTPGVRLASPGTPTGLALSPGPMGSSVTKLPPGPSIAVAGSVQVRNNNPAPPRVPKPTMLGLTGVGPASVNTPAYLRMAPFELQGDRVLLKRKLLELVLNVCGSEGDTDVHLDADVEELLLDLADEFVSSVTGFACRLAKHRKVDAVDVRDVQMHLERNWGIRIPGYANDEVRSVRRWQPAPGYVQKVGSVNLSKQVD